MTNETYTAVQFSQFARHSGKYAALIRKGEKLAILHNGEIIAVVLPVKPETARVTVEVTK